MHPFNTKKILSQITEMRTRLSSPKEEHLFMLSSHGFESHPLHTDNDKYRNTVKHHWITNDTNF